MEPTSGIRTSSELPGQRFCSSSSAPTSVVDVALVLTLLAMAIGTGLGIRWGGQISNVTLWHPVLWESLVGGLILLSLVDLTGVSGSFGAFLVIVATAAILAFSVLNIRVGGMVLVVAGVASNLLVTLFNWGMPVSGSALVSAGIVDRGDLGKVTLTGGRSVADGAFLGFLGDVIPLPWGQVISIGDMILLVGTALVTASVLRQHSVGGGPSPYVNLRGPAGYRNALDALGRGPAPRRGPGLHPSRLNGRRDRQRSSVGRHPR